MTTNTPHAPNLTPAERSKQNRLAELLEKAKDHVMTPEEIAAQRKSWVCGEMLLQYPTMTYDEASERYDAITEAQAPAPQVMPPADYEEKLSSFLDALDEWGCEDNGERAEHIIEFQRTGYDLDAYLAEHPDRHKSEVN